MRSSVEPLDGNKVRVSVEVDEAEFDEALDAAFRKIAREVRVPGFRPGKAPRRLIEARLGPQVARQEALREALPDYYERALQENDITPIAPPEIDITAGQEGGPVAFDAVVEVMPQVSVGGYEGLQVVLPSLEVTEAEVGSQVDKLREQFGELSPVNRPARDGDHVSIDRKVTRHTETILATEDELYEVGKGSIVAELDKELRGKRAGDIVKFNAELPDEGEVTFTVLVKQVRETVLPEVTDEWAGEASEFETVAELRDDIRRRMETVKRLQAALLVRDKVVEALVELVDDDIPASLVQSEVDRRVQDLEHRLGHQKATVADYLQATGQSQEELEASLINEAVMAIKADLGLQSLAEMEDIDVTDEDVDAEIARLAERRKERPEQLRRRLQSGGELPAVRSGLRKNKALDWLVEHTEYVDEDGRAIDRSALQPVLAGPDQASTDQAGIDQADTPDSSPSDGASSDNEAAVEETMQ